MPGYKTHGAGGVLAAGGALALAVWLGHYQPDPARMAGLVAVGGLAALFPDVDTDSRGQHLYYLLLFLADLALIAVGRYVWAAVLGLFAMLPAIGPHRGWTHSWLAAPLVPLPILLLPPYILEADWRLFLAWYLAAVTGYLSHLVLDRIF
ncbi:metal-dependent hydrolase [Desulfohalovibrio reitneri]|uniref:metal-dependent hydrolase n=1 Tax=Desulfohalovibrio reitneri TaxID=1307759 RepID=UPI0004A73780|nr:metal-dependent hydrolase [Desulfohalovibrio reitneri]